MNKGRKMGLGVFKLISRLFVFIIETSSTIQAINAKTILHTLTFSAGVYAGIYISQNYEVPRVDEPAALIEKIKDYADKHRKS